MKQFEVFPRRKNMCMTGHSTKRLVERGGAEQSTNCSGAARLGSRKADSVASFNSSRSAIHRATTQRRKSETFRRVYEQRLRVLRSGVSQDFPYPGKTASRGEMAKRDADVLQQQYESVRRTVLAGIKRHISNSLIYPRR